MNQTAIALPREYPEAELRRGMASAIRALSMDAVEKAKSGHPGMPMGMADVATVLFGEFLKFDPAHPDWPDRDRFVLSAGHGSMLLYAVLHLLGAQEMTVDALKNFRQLGSPTAGHPEYGHAAGIEMTTGPLGQGIASAVGMALAERIKNSRFGDDLTDHHTYVMAGDGCLMEGISHEAIDLAGHLRLSKLIVLFDDNGISIDGATSLATSMDQLKRFEAAGWSACAVDGHDMDAVAGAIAKAQTDPRPSLIACRTIIGFGAPHKQGTAATHGNPLGADEIAAARERLGWMARPFDVPDAIRAGWRAAAERGRAQHVAWRKRLDAAPAETRQAFDALGSGDLREDVDRAIDDLKRQFSAQSPKLATRQSSQKVLEVIAPLVPQLIGGSADLTGSNNTHAGSQSVISAEMFDGNYVHFGVREHGMAAAMNGLALHGGLIPYGGTFLAFADYSRPAIRLAALMGLRVIHVMTHDSIGLGEDGPTHQPVEHLAALRAMPNLNVFRPADAVETAEAWLCALKAPATPSIIALTRQGLPTLRTIHTDENRVQRGAYILANADRRRDITLLASGSEVAAMCDAANQLAGMDIMAAVVSVPSIGLFKAQAPDYRQDVLGTAPRIAMEAAVRDSWNQWLRPEDIFIGMDSFGASAPGDILCQHFGITARAVIEAAQHIIKTEAQPK